MNLQWCLRERPEGEIRREHFDIRSVPVPVPGPGEALVRNIYLFVPPSMRLWMNEKDSYLPAQPLGEDPADVVAPEVLVLDVDEAPGLTDGLGVAVLDAALPAGGERVVPAEA